MCLSTMYCLYVAPYLCLYVSLSLLTRVVDRDHRSWSSLLPKLPLSVATLAFKPVLWHLPYQPMSPRDSGHLGFGPRGYWEDSGPSLEGHSASQKQLLCLHLWG